MKQPSWSITKNPMPVPQIPPWTPGRFYTFHWTTTTAILSAGSTYFATPIYVPNPTGTVIDSIGLELTATGSATASVRIALYEYTDSGFGNLLIDGGAINIATDLGYKGTTGLNYFLPQGWYWGVYTCLEGQFRCNSSIDLFGAGELTPQDLTPRTPILRLTLSSFDIQKVLDDGYPETLPPIFNWGISIGNNARILLGV